MIVRDPIHGDIIIKDQLIIDIINTKEFQRLRRIKQLGFSYLLFPGAEHSRFTHSIGVYHLATRFLNAIEQNSSFHFSPKQKKCFQVAALLHDIGHSALSHTAEDMFEKPHELYSEQIVKSKSTEINKVLKKHIPNGITDIVNIIGKKHSNNILNQLLSSSVDVDRLDYLVRDSHYVGVVYGNIDVSRLLNCVMVIDKQLVFDMKAVNTLEDVVCSRYQMFNQVYTAKKSIGYDTLIKRLYMRAVDLWNAGYQFNCDISKLLPFIIDNITIDDYLKMDDYSLLTIINDFCLESDNELRSYAKHLSCGLPFVEYSEKTYPIFSEGYEKSSYSESIRLLNKGKIILLEDVSPLVKSLKQEKIKIESLELYINEDEN